MNNIIHIIRHTARAATVLLLALLTAQTAGGDKISVHPRSIPKCLPCQYALSRDGVQAMTLNITTRNFADGTLTLNFTAATTIPAGTPFIILSHSQKL